MASLIPSSVQSSFTGIFDSLIDTFARPIIVYKEPIKTAISYSPSSQVFGYGDNQQERPVTYTSVTGVFPATIFYKVQNSFLASDINTLIGDSEVSIQVRSDCRDFIRNDKTEKIGFDSKFFRIDAESQYRPFLNFDYYFFKLTSIS